MTSLNRFVIRSLGVAAVVAVALGMSATAAKADVLTFGVEESVVTGATNINLGGTEVTANGITAKYQENLILNGDGTFTAYLVVQFTDYTVGGNPVTSQIAPNVGGVEGADANLYSLYSLVTVTGTYATQVIDPDLNPITLNSQILTGFSVDTAAASVYTDPFRNTTYNFTNATTSGGAGDDQAVLTASAIDPLQTFGFVTQSPYLAGNPVIGGQYALFFTDPTLVGIGPQYWPTLNALSLFFAVASGDVDPASEGSIFPDQIKGDTSIAFVSTTPVPEPASLVLLGSGLLGLAARRRRKA